MKKYLLSIGMLLTLVTLFQNCQNNGFEAIVSRQPSGNPFSISKSNKFKEKTSTWQSTFFSFSTNPMPEPVACQKDNEFIVEALLADLESYQCKDATTFVNTDYEPDDFSTHNSCASSNPSNLKGGVLLRDFTVPNETKGEKFFGNTWRPCTQLVLCGQPATDTQFDKDTGKTRFIFKNLPWDCEGAVSYADIYAEKPEEEGVEAFTYQNLAPSCPACGNGFSCNSNAQCSIDGEEEDRCKADPDKGLPVGAVYDDAWVFSCKEGEQGLGTPYSCFLDEKTEKAGWVVTGDAECKPIPVQCKPSQELGFSYGYEGESQYVPCGPGFVGEGTAYTCSSEGIWVKLDEPVQCTQTNTMCTSPDGNQHKVGENYAESCPSGMVGSGTVFTCNTTGNWTMVPDSNTCKKATPNTCQIDYGKNSAIQFIEENVNWKDCQKDVYQENFYLGHKGIIKRYGAELRHGFISGSRGDNGDFKRIYSDSEKIKLIAKKKKAIVKIKRNKKNYLSEEAYEQALENVLEDLRHTKEKLDNQRALEKSAEKNICYAPPKYYCPDGTSKPKDKKVCPAGYKCLGGIYKHQPIECRNGTYSTKNSSSCKVCSNKPANAVSVYYNDVINSSSRCSYSIERCKPGYAVSSNGQSCVRKKR